MPKAVFYLRISREDGIKEENESIENQRLLLTEYAGKQNFSVTGEYTDENYSGLDANRPGFRRMLQDARKKKFDVILAKDQSRFSRNLQHIERYLHYELPALGIRFIGVVDGADTDKRENKKARQLFALVNEWYCEDLSESIRAVLLRKIRDGQFIGSKAPYGYQKEKGNSHHLAVNEKEAEVVRGIFSQYLEGDSLRKICRRLEKEKITAPAGGNSWNPMTVRRILTNEVYIGNLCQGKSRTQSFKNPKRIYSDEKDWVKHENTHEPIVSKTSFCQVRQKIARFGKEGL